MSLASSCDHELGTFSNFSVTITLTKKGLEQSDAVIAAVFKYAQEIRDAGPQQYVFEEVQKIGGLRFEFLDKGNCTSYCVGLARRMPRFESPEALRDLIKSQYLFEEFDQARIREIGALLADPKNALISLLSKSFKEETLPELEPWYNIKFSSEPYSAEFLATLTNPVVKDNGKKLGLPPPNNLIPSNFDILPECPDHSRQPVFAQEWENADLWFKKDDKFQKPKGNVGMRIYTTDNNFGSAPMSRVFVEVWKGCLEEYLREYKYSAECAELKFSNTLYVDNVQLFWQGYSDTLPVFVKETLAKIVAMKEAQLEPIFNQVKEELLQRMKNFYLDQTFRLAAQYLDTVVFDNIDERRELKPLLESFTYEDFSRMFKTWLVSGRMLFFVHGNFTKTAAIEFIDEARKIINLKAVSKDSLSTVRHIQITNNHNRIDFPVEDETNENSVLMCYYQSHQDTGDSRIKLLNEICLQFLDEPTFNQLRTNEQLGYVVWSRHCERRDVIGAWFLVQSPNKGCSHIKASFNKHMTNMLDTVAKMSEKAFDEQRNAVLTQYSEKDINLAQEFNRHWTNEIVSHKYIFDRQERECALLKELTLKEFKDHFARMFSFKTMKRLDMHWNSKPHQEQEEKAAHLVDNYPTGKKEKKHASVSALKKAMGLYPDLHKSNYARN